MVIAEFEQYIASNRAYASQYKDIVDAVRCNSISANMDDQSHNFRFFCGIAYTLQAASLPAQNVTFVGTEAIAAYLIAQFGTKVYPALAGFHDVDIVAGSHDVLSVICAAYSCQSSCGEFDLRNSRFSEDIRDPNKWSIALTELVGGCVVGDEGTYMTEIDLWLPVDKECTTVRYKGSHLKSSIFENRKFPSIFGLSIPAPAIGDLIGLKLYSVNSNQYYGKSSSKPDLRKQDVRDVKDLIAVLSAREITGGQLVRRCNPTTLYLLHNFCFPDNENLDASPTIEGSLDEFLKAFEEAYDERMAKLKAAYNCRDATDEDLVRSLPQEAIRPVIMNQPPLIESPLVPLPKALNIARSTAQYR